MNLMKQCAQSLAEFAHGKPLIHGHSLLIAPLYLPSSTISTLTAHESIRVKMAVDNMRHSARGSRSPIYIELLVKSQMGSWKINLQMICF